MSRSRGAVLADVVVDVLATARLTRLVTTDKLGDELIVQPAKEWAVLSDHNHGTLWRGKLADGLECSFCVGFWIGLGVLVLPVPRVLKRALALNYCVGHLSSRLD